MKYLCLGYHEEKTWRAMNEGDRKALLEESFAYAALLRKNGHYIDGKALQDAGTATTLRFDKAKLQSPMVPLPKQRSSWVESWCSKPKT